MNWAAPIVVFVVSVVAATWYGGQRHQARVARLADVQRRARSWPTTPGQILTSDVISWTQGATDSEYTVYAAAVSYRFVVEGAEHVGYAITAGENDDQGNRIRSEDRDDAVARAARFPVGAGVWVHYDPQDPATQSCLEV